MITQVPVYHEVSLKGGDILKFWKDGSLYFGIFKGNTCTCHLDVIGIGHDMGVVKIHAQDIAIAYKKSFVNPKTLK